MRFTVCRMLVGLLLVTAIPHGCAAAEANEEFRYTLNARQVIYQQGAPHIGRDGSRRMTYDADESMFVLALYHALDHLDKAQTTLTPLERIREAGFNCTHSNRGLTQHYLDRLHEHGLRFIKSEARPEEAERFADHPAMLAWEIFDEPDHDGEFAAYPERFRLFEQFRDGIRKHDPLRPIFVNNVAWITPPNLAWWTRWQMVGNVSCHDNYPVTDRNPDLQSWSGVYGIPESVSLAVATTDQRKPVWFIVQSFGKFPDAGGAHWLWPTPKQLRSMVYAAIVHGATGISCFSYDADVTRADGNYFGISPDPLDTYNADREGAIANEDHRQKIRDLWQTAAKINHQLHRLKPWLLSPTSDLYYKVHVRGQSHTKDPVRTLLKAYDDVFVMLVVNVDRAAIDLQIELPEALASKGLVRMFDDPGSASVQEQVLHDHLEPFAVRVYRFGDDGQPQGD